MTRRKVVFTLLSSALLGVKAMAVMPFKVKYTCDTGKTGGAAAFFEHQKRFENSAGIDALSETFKKRGELIDVQFFRHGDLLTWTYIFRDRAAFDAWAAQGLKLGLVDRRQQQLYPIQRSEKYIPFYV